LLGSFVRPKYGALPHAPIVHFFCSSKRNEPKKRAPETKNSGFLSACYAGLKGATKKPEFHTVSGFSLAPSSIYHIGTMTFSAINID
jgi:hypothetical protein